MTDTDLTCQELKHATATRRCYYPDRTFVGAVYDRRGNLIQSTLRYNDRDIVPADSRQIDGIAALSAVRCDEPVALYGGILFPILGHFLLESLSRLWPLLWDRALQPEPPPVFFHPWHELDVPSFMGNPLYRASLDAFGLDESSVRVIERPVQFERLIVPQPGSIYHRQLDTCMIQVADRIASHILSGKSSRARQDRRLYLSRSAWTDGKRIHNEHEIDALMAELGFEIVQTHLLSPADLMTRLREAGTVVASDGSHAHLAVFCTSGTRVMMLDTRPVPSQFAIAALRRFDTLHIPLVDTPHYTWEQKVIDLAPLRPLIETALSERTWHVAASP